MIKNLARDWCAPAKIWASPGSFTKLKYLLEPSSIFFSERFFKIVSNLLCGIFNLSQTFLSSSTCKFE